MTHAIPGRHRFISTFVNEMYAILLGLCLADIPGSSCCVRQNVTHIFHITVRTLTWDFGPENRVDSLCFSNPNERQFSDFMHRSADSVWRESNR